MIPLKGELSGNNTTSPLNSHQAYKAILKDKNIFNYLKSYNSFFFANGLAGSFINILFFNTGNMIIVFEYQIAYLISQLFFYIISGYLSNYVRVLHIYSSGPLIRAISLLSTLFIQGIFLNPVFFGILYGISGGFFWGGNNIASLEVSHGKDRMSFISFNSFVSNLSSLLAPLIGGIAIEATPFTGVFRYTIIFTFTALLMVYSSISANYVKFKESRHKKIKIIDSIKVGKEIKYQYKIFFYFSSIYVFAILIVFPIYILKVTHNYFIVGSLIAFMAAGSVLGNMFSPHLINKNTKKLTIYLYTLAIIIASSSIFLLRINSVVPPFLIGFISLFFVAPLNNKSMSNFMNSLNNVEFSFSHWINREYYLLGGRLTAIFILLMLFLVIGFMQSIEFLFIISFTIILMIPASVIDDEYS